LILSSDIPKFERDDLQSIIIGSGPHKYATSKLDGSITDSKIRIRRAESKRPEKSSTSTGSRVRRLKILKTLSFLCLRM
jgi:hypothetical protein